MTRFISHRFSLQIRIVFRLHSWVTLDRMRFQYRLGGNALEVYRWGAYDTINNTVSSGIRVETLDADDMVQQIETTANTQDETISVEAHTNSTSSERVFTL